MEGCLYTDSANRSISEEDFRPWAVSYAVEYSEMLHQKASSRVCSHNHNLWSEPHSHFVLREWQQVNKSKVW